MVENPAPDPELVMPFLVAGYRSNIQDSMQVLMYAWLHNSRSNSVNMI